MIIVRSPLRITLGGGGTDLPSYYREHGGFVLAAAIQKYVYVAVNKSFRKKISLKYSKLEEVDTPDQVEHPVIREALKMTGISDSIDITSISDIPAGTGLGSSGSFTTALLKALYEFKGEHQIPSEAIAKRAHIIEHDTLGQHVGKQDQYIAATGGITTFSFYDEEVDIAPLHLSLNALKGLENNLLLFFTGYARSASDILEDQNLRTQQNDQDMINNLNFVKTLGYRSRNALKNDNLRYFAELMHFQWLNKKKRSKGMSNQHIDNLYKLAVNNGALGGKLVGAGGGGFLMFYTEEPGRLRMAMADLQEVNIKFDFEGTKRIA